MAKGGEPFQIQPQVAVYNEQNILVPDLLGYVYAEIDSSPTGYETLWIGTCNVTSCGIQVTRDEAKADFSNGVATFQVFLLLLLSLLLFSSHSSSHSLYLLQNLQINTQGTYTLKFVAMTSTKIPFAFTYSSSFVVSVGEPYSLQYIPYFGHLSGGIPFQIQPSVKVTDRGGNIVTSINHGKVTVSLVRQPQHVNTQLLPSTNLQVDFVSGLAQFSGLFINEAGSPYQMKFQTNLVTSLLPSLSHLSLTSHSHLSFTNSL